MIFPRSPQRDRPREWSLKVPDLRFSIYLSQQKKRGEGKVLRRSNYVNRRAGRMDSLTNLGG